MEYIYEDPFGILPLNLNRSLFQCLSQVKHHEMQLKCFVQGGHNTLVLSLFKPNAFPLHFWLKMKYQKPTAMWIYIKFSLKVANRVPLESGLYAQEQKSQGATPWHISSPKILTSKGYCCFSFFVRVDLLLSLSQNASGLITHTARTSDDGMLSCIG